MLELVLRTTVILAVAWMIACVLRRATAATRHLVWHCAIVAVLVAPIAAPLAPKIKVPLPRATVGGTHSADPTTSVAVGSSSTRSPLGTSPVGPVGTFGTFGTFGTLVWAVGSAALVLWFLLGWASSAITARRAQPASAEWQIETNGLREKLRLGREVDVRVVSRPISPAAVGLWRSVILLPEAARAWDADCRRSVLFHELAHIQRRDLPVQALAQLACCAYWFNPFVWVAFVRLRAERERACDDVVLQCGARPSVYAAHLLEIARELQPTLVPSASLAMARASELEGRLLSVLAIRRSRVPARATRWAIMATFAVATTTAFGAAISDTSDSAVLTEQPSAAVGTRWIFPPVEALPAERLAARRAIVDASETLASSPDAQERQRAAIDLAASGQADSVHPLEKALNDSDQDVREKAALGLALMSTPDVIPILLKALADPDAQVREKAAIGLAMRRNSEVTEALIDAMNDPDSQVREKVAIALGTSGDSRAIAVLERALDDPDAQVREKAVTGLTLLRNGGVDTTQGDHMRDGLRGLLGLIVGLAK